MDSAGLVPRAKTAVPGTSTGQHGTKTARPRTGSVNVYK